MDRLYLFRCESFMANRTGLDGTTGCETTNTHETYVKSVSIRITRGIRAISLETGVGSVLSICVSLINPRAVCMWMSAEQWS